MHMYQLAHEKIAYVRWTGGESPLVYLHRGPRVGDQFLIHLRQRFVHSKPIAFGILYSSVHSVLRRDSMTHSRDSRESSRVRYSSLPFTHRRNFVINPPLTALMPLEFDRYNLVRYSNCSVTRHGLWPKQKKLIDFCVWGRSVKKTLLVSEPLREFYLETGYRHFYFFFLFLFSRYICQTWQLFLLSFT